MINETNTRSRSLIFWKSICYFSTENKPFDLLISETCTLLLSAFWREVWAKHRGCAQCDKSIKEQNCHRAVCQRESWYGSGVGPFYIRRISWILGLAWDNFTFTGYRGYWVPTNLGHFSRYDSPPFRHNAPTETVLGLISNLDNFFSFALFLRPDCHFFVTRGRGWTFDWPLGGSLCSAAFLTSQLPFSLDFPRPWTLDQSMLA